MSIGYTLMCEQAGPKALVADAQAAESAGFEFAVISDHYFPWVEAMGHSPYAWAVLGAVAQATERIELMTYVTCPIKRYHPVVVAQKAATMALLADDRFTLGVGAGENLNEHVTGGGWPPVNIRHLMLAEALDIIRALWQGGYVNYQGKFFHVDSAKLWDLPEQPPRLGVAASGPQSSRLAGQYADCLIAVEPDPSIVEAFDAGGGGSKPRVGQLPVCYDQDRDAAVKRALTLFGWFGGGWKVNSELPSTSAFEAVSSYVRPEDITRSIPCGSSVREVEKALDAFARAGFTHVALCQIGGGDHQREFIHWAEQELLPALAAHDG